MDKNITIPLSLLRRTIDLLEYWNISEYDPTLRQDYDNILFALYKKKQTVELRDAYAKIIYADSEDARFDARMRYLERKRLIEEPF